MFQKPGDRMRRLFLAVTLSIAALGAALAPVRAMANEDGLQATILDQIDAFRADDFVRAFDFASPTIRSIFQTPERFGQMVRNGYPMVWRPDRVQMLDSRVEGGVPHQRVLVTDAEGRAHVLDYEMIETPDGWRINGVTLERAPGVGA